MFRWKIVCGEKVWRQGEGGEREKTSLSTKCGFLSYLYRTNFNKNQESLGVGGGSSGVKSVGKKVFFLGGGGVEKGVREKTP